MIQRVVFDTNLIVSAVLLAGSVSRQAFDKALEDCKVLISVSLLFEIIEVLSREKFNKYVTEAERMRFLVGFLKVAEMVEITETIEVCRDTKDDKLLELSVSGDADFLITGDNDLLVLNPFRGVEILNPREFLDKF